MKTKFIISITTLLLIIIGWQYNSIRSIKADRDVYKRNTVAHLKDVEHYRTKDSLNVATVNGMELKLAEFKKYRTEDHALIQSLQVKNRELERLTTARLQTAGQIHTTVRDSIVFRDSVYVPLRCMDITEKWFELHGCIDENRFTGTYINRDELSIVETVKYKRLLGFLWKTSKVKDRKVDVVSKNPSTRIVDVEFISIRK